MQRVYITWNKNNTTINKCNFFCNFCARQTMLFVFEVFWAILRAALRDLSLLLTTNLAVTETVALCLCESFRDIAPVAWKRKWQIILPLSYSLWCLKRPSWLWGDCFKIKRYFSPDNFRKRFRHRSQNDNAFLSASVLPVPHIRNSHLNLE